MRHFSAALRVIAIAPSFNLGMLVLRLKEKQDARRRGLPLNQADLELNEIAGRLVRELRGYRAGAKLKKPLPIESWASRIRKALGEASGSPSN